MPKPAAGKRRGPASAPRPRRLRLESLEERRVLAINASLVVDLNLAEIGSHPGDFTALNGQTYFFASQPEIGRGLWKTDGTAAGTQLVKELPPEQAGFEPTTLIAAGNRLYFVDYNKLWISDGTTAGTTVVPRGEDAAFEYINITGTAGDRLVFTHLIVDPVVNYELWSTDGVSSTALAVLDAPGLQGYRETANLNGSLYFVADDGVHGREIWKTDGTPAGTGLMQDIVPVNIPFYSISELTAAGDQLFFTAPNGDGASVLWVTDGTPSGARVVESPTMSGMHTLAAAGDTLFFQAHGPGGSELWKSDGTSAGTMRVKDINPLGNSYPSNLTGVGDALYFLADMGATGLELWRSDGTETGTVRVIDFAPISHHGDIAELTAFGEQLFFAADDGVSGQELWITDGTAAGTKLVKDIFAGGHGAPEHLAVIGQTLYFSGGDLANGFELWKSDGTAAGTGLVRNLAVGQTEASNPQARGEVNGIVLFTAQGTGNGGRELWRTDGMPGGTRLLKEFAVGRRSASLGDNFVTYGNRCYFIADDGTHGQELWSTDGTEEGTYLMADSAAGPESGLGLFNGFAAFGEQVYFTAYDLEDGYGVYRTDGTPAGTSLFYAFNPPSFFESPRNYSAVGGSLYFTAPGPGTLTLWKSDGTPAGTQPVDPAGQGPRVFSTLVDVGGRGVFIGEDRLSGEMALWSADGTPAGTIRLPMDVTSFYTSFQSRDFAVVNGQLLLTAGPASDLEAWKTNGVPAGTQLLEDVLPGPFGAIPTHYHALGNRAYFRNTAGAFSTEIWTTDGTPGAGSVLKQFGSQFYIDLQYLQLADAGGRLYFTGIDDDHGQELWTSDGTPAGTFLVRDIVAGPVSSLAKYGERGLWGTSIGQVFFGVDDGQHGAELWMAGDYSPVSHVLPDIVDVAPDPRQTPVGPVAINFTEDVTGVDLADFLLTRNGEAVPLTAVAVAGAGRSYMIDLSSATTGPGVYTLTLQPAGVFDGGGLPVTASAQEVFRIDAGPWHNTPDPLNVDGVGGIIALDALLVVNEINNRLFSDAVTGTILIPAPTAQFPFFLDTSGDGFITGIDALLIFNWLNTHPLPGPGGEGELASSAPECPLEASASTGCDAALLAFLDEVPRGSKRRR